MIYRIEIAPKRKWHDARGEGVKKQIRNFLKLEVDEVWTRDVFTVDADITGEQASSVAQLFANPVLHDAAAAAESAVRPEAVTCDYMVAVGFKPGVTDNVGRTAREAIADVIGRKLNHDEAIYSSVEYLIYGKQLSFDDVNKIASDLLANELIESVRVFRGADVAKGIPLNLPLMKNIGGGVVHKYNLEVNDDALMEISRKGILALSLAEMKSIQNYFRHAEGREKFGLDQNPTDVELEVLAQTWSEHCKHKIFDAIINYEDKESGKAERIVSCYKSFIKKST
ncbi:MAG: hypothetical protein RR060_01375, partial [Victivallaceae bacterium]